MAYGVVYRVACLVTGKSYHGQTISPAERWSHHLRRDSHCHALRQAIAKYGKESFTFEIVAEASSSDELNTLERKYVETSMAPTGYNLIEGGSSRRPSAETRLKLSKTHKAIQNLPDVRARNSAAVKRALARPEVKEKQRAAIKARFADPDERVRASLRMKEVHARSGEREKRSQSLKAAWQAYSPEERAARITRQKNSLTPEVRLSLGEHSRALWSDPGYKAVQAEQRRAAQNRPEVKAAKSACMKEIHARPGDRERRGAAISRAHNSVEGRAKLARRRRRGESMDAWRVRVARLEEQSEGCVTVGVVI